MLLITVFSQGQLPSAPGSEIDQMAQRYDFTPLTIAMPAGLDTQSVRSVNQNFDRLPAWVSSVGAGIAMNDLTGDGLANDLCVTDPRYDEAVVTPVPQRDGARYQPFVLDPDPLPVDSTMAPMGCVPGDFDADGLRDVLVYYWGRTPIVFLGNGESASFSAEAFTPVEMIDGASSGDRYTGPLWNTNAVSVADFDGDGYEDILVGNYWPHGPVLDDARSTGVAMPSSLSQAFNGGETYIYRSTAGDGGGLGYERAEGVLSDDVRDGWVLAAAAADLDGDVLPELYLAHDFGPDRLLYNRSTPGNIRLENVLGDRHPLVPKSKVIGRDSFKGMGVDIADFTGDGMRDIFVSNITTSYGIQESNFAFVNTASDHAALRREMSHRGAPFEDRSASLGLAWSGWAWDVKVADLDNSGDPEIIQTTGFVKGRVDRWPQLQEMATTNDGLLADPQMWPHLRQGDDVAGDQPLAFFARTNNGRFTNLSEPLGLAEPLPGRGVAVGDADGDGRLDFAIARQWSDSVFYHNESPDTGEFLGLTLLRDGRAGADGPGPTGRAAGSPVVGAQVTVTTQDGRRFLGRVDGGSGHAGKRSHAVVVGLGDVSGPLAVEIVWRDRDGRVHEQVRQLAPGWHTFRLGERAEAVTS